MTRHETVLRAIERLDAVKRLALVDAVADLLEQVDAGTLVDRRASGSRQTVQLKAVNAGDHTAADGCDVKGEITDIGAAGCGPLGRR